LSNPFPFTETASGNKDQSAFQFKPSMDHHAVPDPEINDISKEHPEHPAHPFKFADDDGSAHPGHATGKDKNISVQPSADPKIGDIAKEHPEHPAHPHSDNFTFADNDDHPGKASHDDSKINDIANDLPPQHTADNWSHMQHDDDGSPAATDGANPGRGQGDRSEPASFKFADDVSDHGTGPNGAHPADPQVDGNQSDSFKFADGGDHPGTITNDPTAVTAPPSDSSGTHGPAAPTLAKTDVPDAGISAAPDQFVFADNTGHGAVADHKPDVTEIDHTVPADIQHLLDTAHETNAVNHATASQDMTKFQLPHHGDFHFA
jgi:hypothetical protein